VPPEALAGLEAVKNDIVASTNALLAERKQHEAATRQQEVAQKRKLLWSSKASAPAGPAAEGASSVGSGHAAPYCKAVG